MAGNTATLRCYFNSDSRLGTVLSTRDMVIYFQELTPGEVRYTVVDFEQGLWENG